MESNKSSFWFGLGIGSVIGALVYRFSCTEKAKELKIKVYEAYHKITSEAEEMVEEAKEKAMNAGTTVADKVANATFNIAEKADDVKGKMHSAAFEAKK